MAESRRKSAMRTRTRIVLGVPAAVLAIALVLQFSYSLQPVALTKPVHLRTAVPLELPGFTSRDELLGPNERMKNVVAEALNYDVYVNRVYQRGDLELGIYIAYWGPGKASTREV